MDAARNENRSHKAAGPGRERPHRVLTTEMLAGLLRISDGLAVALSGWLIAMAYFGEVLIQARYLLPIAAGVVLVINIYQFAGLYGAGSVRAPLGRLLRLGAGWSLAVALVIVAGFIAKQSDLYSRGWTVLWFVIGFGAILGGRWLFARIVGRLALAGSLRRRVAIIADLPLAPELERHIAGTASGHYAFSTWSPPDVDPQGFERLIELCRNDGADLVLIALPWSQADRIETITRRLAVLPADIRLVPEAAAHHLLHRRVTYLDGLPLLHVADKPISGWDRLVKWLEDRSVALAALIVLAPLMLGAAIAIRLETSGPVLFRQPRRGFNDRVFDMLKFRTMHHDRTDTGAAELTRPGDVRVTRVGRFLRKWSIDELPQLINVLRGEMSIVGPRPHALEAKAGGTPYDEIVADYSARHRVRPGMTGWAQVNGLRGYTGTEEELRRRVEYDMFYIENWTPLLDLKIILMTIAAVLRHEKAH